MYRSVNALNYDPEYLLSKAEVTPSCWLWKGSTYQNGYGKYGKRGHMVHRIFYALFKGEVPQDMSLDHLCKVRRCVNPDHLEIVTLVENVMRGDSQHAKNARKTHCKRGHELTVENIYIHPQRGHRQCRTCRAMADRVFQRKKIG